MNESVEVHLARPSNVTIVLTTYKTDTLYTQACLEAIRRWKAPHHELIVVVHDESALLRAYLEACVEDGLVDKLLFANARHGHTRSFNLGVQYAHGETVFNICNDILIGPSLVDDCAHKLLRDPQLGLIGWHWHNEGTFWEDDEVKTYRLKDENNPQMPEDFLTKMKHSDWFTGRLFEAMDGPKWLHVANTAFFGARREVLQKIGGGFSLEFDHFWADDFLCYAVLDQGMDVRHFEEKFRSRKYFHEFQYENTDVEDRRRLTDQVDYDGAFLDSIELLGGGMSRHESVFLHLLASAVKEGSVVTNVGVWRGSSAIVLLDALKDKQATFHFIDCFDDPTVSQLSGQPPVARKEFLKYIEPYISPLHQIFVTRANTLMMDCFPESDFVFVDAGHTRECVQHDGKLVRECLKNDGVAVFHDYGSSIWRDVKPELDNIFPGIEACQTMGVYRFAATPRHTYSLPSKLRIQGKPDTTARQAEASVPELK